LGAHNIHFYLQLMRTMRRHILEGTWLEFYRAQRDVLDARDSYGNHHGTSPTRNAARQMKRGRYESWCETTSVAFAIASPGDHALGQRTAEEARSLYVEQSRLSERLRAPSNAPSPAPLVIWDVGLGAAANAMARSRRRKPSPPRPGRCCW